MTLCCSAGIPPFDGEYFAATRLLSQAEREGAKVFNRAAAAVIRKKLAIMGSPTVAPVGHAQRSRIREFHAEHRDIILKPLDGMGGMGIFRVKDDEPGQSSDGHDGAQSVMGAALPACHRAWRQARVLIGSQPVPFCLARIPQRRQVRGNGCGRGRGVQQPLVDSVATRRTLGPVLAARGLLLVGLDVSGDHCPPRQINAPSPPASSESNQTGFNVAGMMIDALERHA